MQLPPAGQFATAVVLDDEPRAQVRRISGSVVELTIHEGRNHQVKRMFEAVGHRVKRLHRSRYGPLQVGGLEPGAWRELEPGEVEVLRAAPGGRRGRSAR